MAHLRRVTGLLRTMEAEKTHAVMEELLEGPYGRPVQSLDVLEEAFSKVHSREKLLEAVIEETVLKDPLEVITKTESSEAATHGKSLAFSDWHFGLENLLSEVEQKLHEALHVKTQGAYNYRGQMNMYEVVIEPVRSEIDFLFTDRNDIGLDVQPTTSGVFVRTIRPETPAAFARPKIQVGDELLLVAGLPANTQLSPELWKRLPLSLTLRRSNASSFSNPPSLPYQVPEPATINL